jgi:hypothetical protein
MAHVKRKENSSTVDFSKRLVSDSSVGEAAVEVETSAGGPDPRRTGPRQLATQPKIMMPSANNLGRIARTTWL